MSDFASVLEGYLVTDPVKVSFFGKQWNPRVDYEDVDPSDCADILKEFQKKSAKLSKAIEDSFCAKADVFNEDPSYSKIPAGSIKSYSNIRGLELTNICFSKLWNSNKIMLIIRGEYAIDGEHGWSFAFLNGTKPCNAMKQYSDGYYDQDFLPSAKQNRNNWMSAKAQGILNKIGYTYDLSGENRFNKLEDFFEDIIFLPNGKANLRKLKTADMKALHYELYTEKEAIRFFNYMQDPRVAAFIKKYQPMPISSNGFGDKLCWLNNGKVEEFVHSVRPCFGTEGGDRYKSIQEAVEDFITRFEKAGRDADLK